MKRLRASRSVVVLGVLTLVLSPSHAGAVGRGKAVYIGGTLAGVKEKIEAPIDLTGEEHLCFLPKGASALRIPWSGIQEIEYGQRFLARQENEQSTLVRQVPHQSRAKAMLHEPAAHELAQYPLDHRPQRTVRLGEQLWIDAQELLEVLLDETKERGLPRPTRPVHPRTDLHATPTAGGRHRRESRTSPRCPGRRACDELASR